MARLCGTGDYLYNDAVMATFVYAPELSEADTISRDLDTLSIPTTATENLFLPTSGRFGSSIQWISSNPAVIDPVTGVVNRPAEGGLPWL